MALHRKQALNGSKALNNCKQVRAKKTLWKAWRHVFRSSLTSASKVNREAAWEFDAQAASRIDRIQRQLRESRFRFAPSRGIPKKRKGKSPRPIVDAPLGNKIVQRAILSVAQEIPKVKVAIKNPASFGALEGRSVKHAMEAIVDAIDKGATFYVRSDIQNFFSNIPKLEVELALSQLINDSAFVSLIMQALEVELDNLQELGAHKEFFPLHEIGIAQGCCLSPFIGNVLLREFDRRMNGRGIACFRYVDDFVILGPNQRSLRKAFIKAKDALQNLGLSAYDPYADNDKAKAGSVTSGFEFLGCSIRPGMISPSKAAKLSILAKVRDIRNRCERAMSSPDIDSAYKDGFSHSLSRISNTLRGWGNQYSFCNDGVAIQQLDEKVNDEIDKLLRVFNKRCRSASNNNDYNSVRRILGVHLLVDCNRAPIV